MHAEQLRPDTATFTNRTDRLPRRESLLDKVISPHIREGGLIEAYVPISLIDREEVPVDAAHVKELALSIKLEANKGSRTGQLSPVLLGEISESPKFHIIDGFHRVGAMDQNGQTETFATVRPKSTLEDIVDLRILATASHKSVQFARLIEWVEQAWQLSPWVDRLKVSQAFGLKAMHTTGKHLGLKDNEINDIRLWVIRKCEQWQLSPPAIYNKLVVAQVADPELIREARERKGGHRLEAITPLHLSAIARTLPNRYEIQRIIAEAAKAQTLTIPMTLAMAKAVVESTSPEETRRIIDVGHWKDQASLNQTKEKKPAIKKEKILFRQQDKEDLRNCQPQIVALTKLGYDRNEAENIALTSLRLFDNIPITNREKGRRLYYEGDLTESVVLLKSGHVLVYNNDKHGRHRYISEIADSPTFLGDEILNGAQQKTYTLEALTDCNFQTLKKANFVDKLKEEPKLALFLFVSQSIKKQQNQKRTLDLMSKQVLLRVASAVSDLIKRPEISPQDFTHQFIADYAICSREMASRELATLTKLKVLKWVTGIGPQFIDENALKMLTD